MKELRAAKPVGRHKEKMVEVPAARHKEKVASDASVAESVASKSALRQPCGQNSGVAVRHEDRLENSGHRQVLPERAQFRTCGQDNAISRTCGQEKTVNKSFTPSCLDLESRFEDKFPHRQLSMQGKVNRPEEKLPQRLHCAQDNTASRHALDKAVNRSITQDKADVRLNAQERTVWQEPQRRHERATREPEMRPVVMRHQHHDKPAEVPNLEKFRRQAHLQDRNKEICDRVQAQMQRSKTLLKDTRKPLDHQEVRERASAQTQRFHVHETQETRERISAHSQRQQPIIKGTPDQRERASLIHKQHQQDLLLREAHEHETKLIQRQQYLQEKVRSRKMMLGSVISSDMSFSSEACRNWYSSALLSTRYREQKTWNQPVLSADSGCSMGEGSMASRRNSETETDDPLLDDLPTIVAEMGEVFSRRVPTKCQKCQRIRYMFEWSVRVGERNEDECRCEMKDASSQHSHPPSETGSPPSSPLTESLSSATIDVTTLDVFSSPPPDRIHQCRVIRDKNTYGTLFYPVYRMYLERDGRPEILLLTARKRKKCSTSKYLICTGSDELRRKSSSLVGKLRSNLVGTRFHLATYVKGSEPEDYESIPGSPEPFKIDSLLLFYETNILGTKGPRRMKVFLPEEGRADEEMNLLERVRESSMEGVLTLVNKEPEWDPDTLSHILYFEGRVTKSSVKNFQLVEPPEDTKVLLQFGKIGRNEFTLDYQTPMNAVQAFAIALSSFDGKIACE